MQNGGESDEAAISVYGLSSIEPDDNRGEVDSREEIDGAFVIAGCDGAKLLEFGEEILDEVTRFIELFVVLALMLAIGFWRDDGALASFVERLDNTLVGIEAFVGDHNVGLDLRQQDVGAVEIAGLSGCEREAGWIAQSINRRIDLGAQSAFAAPDGFVLANFFWAPAEC